MRTSESRMVTHRQHPTLPLEIRSYNKRAFYTKTWNEETMNSRGHVTTLDGKVVSAPFTKFLNIGETEQFSREWVEHLILKHYKEVRFYQKYNGHFCQLFEYEGQWINTTKGTFEHDFIEPDRALIRESGLTDEVLADVNPNWTILFEVLGNHDRHMLHDLDIASFGVEGLEETVVIIGVFDRLTQREVLEDEIHYHLHQVCTRHGEPTPFMSTSCGIRDIFADIIRSDDPDAPFSVPAILDALYDLEDTEGVVIHIPSLNWRVKLKTNWFIRNRYMRQFTNERVQQIFIRQRDEEKVFSKVPEEFHEPLSELWNNLQLNLDEIRRDFMELTFALNEAGYGTRDEMLTKYKEYAPDETHTDWLTGNRSEDMELFRAFFDGEDLFFDAVVRFVMTGYPPNFLLSGFMREDLV